MVCLHIKRQAMEGLGNYSYRQTENQLPKMEAFLSEISVNSKCLFEFRDMFEYENRLKTFTQWPFKENCKCSPENMASAGFIHCRNTNEPDVAKCFFCLIELEGWEPDHNPHLEHSKRSKDSCGFLSLLKNFDDLTVEEYYELEMERVRIFLSKTGRSVINAFEKEVAITRKRLVDHFVSKYQYTPESEKLLQGFFQCPVPVVKEQCVPTTKLRETEQDGHDSSLSCGQTVTAVL